MKGSHWSGISFDHQLCFSPVPRWHAPNTFLDTCIFYINLYKSHTASCFACKRHLQQLQRDVQNQRSVSRIDRSLKWQKQNCYPAVHSTYWVCTSKWQIQPEIDSSMLNHDMSTLIDSGTYGKSHSPLQSVPGGQKQKVQKISLSIANEPCQINETSTALHCSDLIFQRDPLQPFSFAVVLRRPVKYILTQRCHVRWFLLDLKATSFHSKQAYTRA